MSTYEKALEIATKAHEGQTRWNGDPYITHPIRVAEANKLSFERQVVGILHDVVEDTNVTLDDLREAGFCRSIIEAIDSLTKRYGETYADFIERCSEDDIARVVKVSDLEDNMRDLDKNSPRYTKYRLSWLFLRKSIECEDWRDEAAFNAR